MVVALPDGYKADTVAAALVEHMATVPTHLRRSLTWDRGREIASHATITAALSMPVFFCDPHHPWQRGTNENTVRTAVALRREQTHRRVVGPRLHHLGIVGYLPVLFQRRGSGHSRTRRSWRLQPHPAGLSALSRGERPVVFGDDYPTPDGTCIRDYVHVADIADAHVVAACALQAGGPSATCNVGRGEGSSVLDVLRVRRGHRDHHRTRCTDQAFR
jgi:hypothetical protein